MENAPAIDFNATKFHGAGYDKEIDHTRLSGQLKRIYDFMSKYKDRWVTLEEISQHCHAPEASASAALRSLRNQHGYIVERKRAAADKGLWLYRIEGRQENSPPMKLSKRLELKNKELTRILDMFVKCACPVVDGINNRGYNWNEAQLDDALIIAKQVLTNN